MKIDSVRKKLPLGIQTFSEIISEGHYYVDKTRAGHQLITEGKYYFLSRPRRFGKSLFLDTLKELFECNEPLFRGLYIHDKWNWSEPAPVIRISLGGGVLKTPEALDQLLQQILDEHERRFDLPARYQESRSRLRDLIGRLYQQTGRKVVVLIDEYDKPVLDNIDADGAMLTSLREGLKNIYIVIKECDAHIRFAFVTGVSKFSKVSLFSGLNNLEDITLDPAYSAICGYTDDDLDRVFAPELPGLDREQIRRWYNGYNWLGESVYNPFDLLRLFRRRVFHAWWFESATPTFLIKLMTERGFFTPNLAALHTGPDLISSFEVDAITPEALLFQTGYLTIKDAMQMPSGTWRYTLCYPNREVETCLNAALLGGYINDAGQSDQNRFRLEELLLAADIKGMQDLFTAFFASIPHHWHTRNEIARFEGYYASVFYSYFAALGFELRVEDVTSLGRIDMTLKLPQQIYLFEFKVVESMATGRALQQLKDKAYADKYRADGLPIYLIGVEFSSSQRNVVGFEAECL